MTACEKCWSDAYKMMLMNGKTHYDNYRQLLAERIDKECSPQEQAGQWWDDEKQRDLRKQGQSDE